ncbi:MAG: hypothetical protein IJD96_06955 [Lachnospiraceae bacterium]|nr:hypothetical protein [Lachnospiraceae bacterium]
MKESKIHESSPFITKYELIDKLPNPFIFSDGTKVETVEDWKRRREEIFEAAVTLQYGTMPPEPEIFEVEPYYFGGPGWPNCYRITSGTRANPVIFTMTVFKADTKEKVPAVIDGDHCFGYVYDKEYIRTFLDRGIHLVMFNRTELAPDIAQYNQRDMLPETYESKAAQKIYHEVITKNCGGQLKRAYPDCTFGAVGAWAWGYLRCVDALEKLGFADMNLIAFTGHSRGGKAAALAGVLDERAAIVNPNATCQGAYGSYRINIEVKEGDGSIETSEPLSNIFHHFPTWLGPEMKEYIGREKELPFDSHYLKALVAPRILFVSESADDILANPVGSYQTTEAAAEVFKFLGCEENLLWYFRKGKHSHSIEDVEQLVNIIKHVQTGQPLNDKFFQLPFQGLERAYDWK